MVSLASRTILLGLKAWCVRELEGRYLHKRSLNGLTRCHHKRKCVGWCGREMFMVSYLLRNNWRQDDVEGSIETLHVILICY